MTDPVTPKYTINPSLIASNAPVLLRQLTIVVGAVVAVGGLLSRHDAAGLLAYVQSSNFATAIATASTLGALGYGQWKAFHDRQQLVEIAHAAPDHLAVVTGPTPPPSVEPSPTTATQEPS